MSMTDSFTVAPPAGLRPVPMIVDRRARTEFVPGSAWRRLECAECLSSVVTQVPPQPPHWPLHRCGGRNGEPTPFTSAVDAPRPRPVDVRPEDRYL